MAIRPLHSHRNPVIDLDDARLAHGSVLAWDAAKQVLTNLGDLNASRAALGLGAGDAVEFGNMRTHDLAAGGNLNVAGSLAVAGPVSGITLADLDGVGLPAAPMEGQVLKFQGGEWISDNIELTVDMLSDVEAPTPAEGDVLKRRGDRWVPEVDVTGSISLSDGNLEIMGNLVVSGTIAAAGGLDAAEVSRGRFGKERLPADSVYATAANRIERTLLPADVVYNAGIGDFITLAAVADEAEQGNADRWDKAKLPTDALYATESNRLDKNVLPADVVYDADLDGVAAVKTADLTDARRGKWLKVNDSSNAIEYADAPLLSIAAGSVAETQLAAEVQTKLNAADVDARFPALTGDAAQQDKTLGTDASGDNYALKAANEFAEGNILLRKGAADAGHGKFRIRLDADSITDIGWDNSDQLWKISRTGTGAFTGAVLHSRSSLTDLLGGLIPSITNSVSAGDYLALNSTMTGFEWAAPLAVGSGTPSTPTTITVQFDGNLRSSVLRLNSNFTGNPDNIMGGYTPGITVNRGVDIMNNANHPARIFWDEGESAWQMDKGLDGGATIHPILHDASHYLEFPSSLRDKIEGYAITTASLSGNSGKIMQVNTNGNGVDFVDLPVSSLFSASDSLITAANTDTADHIYLTDADDSNASKRMTVAEAKTLFATDISGIRQMPAVGSANQILAVNSAGTAAEWVSPTNATGLFAADDGTETAIASDDFIHFQDVSKNPDEPKKITAANLLKTANISDIQDAAANAALAGSATEYLIRAATETRYKRQSGIPAADLTGTLDAARFPTSLPIGTIATSGNNDKLLAVVNGVIGAVDAPTTSLFRISDTEATEAATSDYLYFTARAASNASRKITKANLLKDQSTANITHGDFQLEQLRRLTSVVEPDPNDRVSQNSRGNAISVRTTTTAVMVDTFIRLADGSPTAIPNTIDPVEFHVTDSQLTTTTHKFTTTGEALHALVETTAGVSFSALAANQKLQGGASPAIVVARDSNSLLWALLDNNTGGGGDTWDLQARFYVDPDYRQKTFVEADKTYLKADDLEPNSPARTAVIPYKVDRGDAADTRGMTVQTLRDEIARDVENDIEDRFPGVIRATKTFNQTSASALVRTDAAEAASYANLTVMDSDEALTIGLQDSDANRAPTGAVAWGREGAITWRQIRDLARYTRGHTRTSLSSSRHLTQTIDGYEVSVMQDAVHQMYVYVQKAGGTGHKHVVFRTAKPAGTPAYSETMEPVWSGNVNFAANYFNYLNGLYLDDLDDSDVLHFSMIISVHEGNLARGGLNLDLISAAVWEIKHAANPISDIGSGTVNTTTAPNVGKFARVLGCNRNGTLGDANVFLGRTVNRRVAIACNSNDYLDGALLVYLERRKKPRPITPEYAG